MTRTVITFGTFDVFHVGHLRVVERDIPDGRVGNRARNRFVTNAERPDSHRVDARRSAGAGVRAFSTTVQVHGTRST